MNLLQDEKPSSAQPVEQEPATDQPPSSPDQTGGDVEGASIDQESGASDSIDFLSAEGLQSTARSAYEFIKDKLYTIDILVQLGVLAGALVPAAIFGPTLKSLILDRLSPLLPHPFLKRICRAFSEIATPIALFLTLQIARAVISGMGLKTGLVEAAVALLSAWIVIRLVTLVIRSQFWSKVAFYIAWPIAALDAFGVLGNVVGELEKFSFPIGENDAGQAIKFSALDAVRVLIVFAVLISIANFAKRFLAERIRAVDELTPSIKAMLIKIIDILLPIIALLMALQIVGFNLATLTIFGGAIGLGVGLGMQNTVSNFIAGFTLVADKSIKPGDVIEVGDTFGWVTVMGARYVTVRTRDGTEHLVPNDQFIQQGVTNWSHADKVIRLHAPFGVAYGTADLRLVKRLAEEACEQHERVLKSPKPRCNLMAFGESAVEYDLRFWINDPTKGISNVRSDVFLSVWQALKDNDIQIPFPQRDLHIKSMPSGLGLNQNESQNKTQNKTLASSIGDLQGEDD